MDQSKPDERIEKLAMKVNLNIRYKLGTSFIGYESLVRQRESPLNLHLVAMIIRCSFVSSSVQIMQHTISFVLFLFISQMPLMQKSFIFLDQELSKILLFWTQSNHCSWNHSESEQHGIKAEIGNSEWTKSLILRTASVCEPAPWHEQWTY